QGPVPPLRLQRVPRGRRDGTRAAARGRVRKPGAAVGRKRGERRRAIRVGFDPRSESAGGGGLCAGDADFRGPDRRGRSRQARRLCGIDRTGAGSPMNAPHQPSYLSATVGIRSWLLTTDHKRIALLYFAGITFFFFIGGIAATLIRLELITP